MPSEESKQLIETLRAQPILQGNTPAEMRAGMEANSRQVDSDVTTEDTTAGGVPARFFSAPAADTSKVVLYLHGGGYVIGSPTTHAWLTGAISRASGMRVLSLDYRLAPENACPAAIQDAVFAYQSLVESGYAPENIAIAGDSAGGGLTAAALVSIRERELPMPAAAALLSPWTDLAATGASITERSSRDPIVGDPSMITMMANNYLLSMSPRDPQASPLYADLKGLPPLLIQVGSEEVLFDDASRLHARAKEAGVDSTFEEWDGQVHVFQMQGWMVPEGQQAIDKIGAFLKARVGTAVPA